MNYAYHRLARSWPKYAWWKPLVTGVIALAIYFVMAAVMSIIFFIIALTDPQGVGVPFDRMIYENVIDNSSPFILTFALGAVALMLPALVFATLIMGPRPLGLLSSVTGRLRWRWMLRLVRPAVIAFGASFALYFFVLPPLMGDEFLPPVVTVNTWVLLAVVVLLVPLQATDEEYVFRGYLMQSIGGWLKHPAFAILLPVPIFMLGHLYDIWGLLDVGVFALFAGWLTWRTGGLEAAIVAHVVNNASIFALGAFELVDANATEGSAIGVLVTGLTLAAYSWFVVRAADRGGVKREREVPVPVPVAPAAESIVVPAEPPVPIVDTQP